MAIDEETARKLNFLPKYELERLIKNYYDLGELNLKMVQIGIVKRESKDPLKLISILSQENLIKIAKQTDIPANIINTLYEEYLHGKNPSLFLRRMIRPKKKTIDQLRRDIPKRFSQISKKLEKEKEGKVRKLEYLDTLDVKGIFEIEFKYQARIDYIDPATEKPDIVYELKRGLIWISFDEGIMVIDVDDWALLSYLVYSFSKYFGCKIQTLKLTKGVIDSIFRKEDMIRGSYYNPYPATGKVRSKILSDSFLLTIDEGKVTNDTYDRTSSFHHIHLQHIGIEAGTFTEKRYGRISIRKHLKKSEVRKWAFYISQRIIGQMNGLMSNNPMDYIRALDPDMLDLMSEIKGNTSKRSLLDVIAYIAEMKIRKTSEMGFYSNPAPFKSGLRKYFDVVFEPVCPQCQEVFHVCKECGRGGTAQVSSRGYVVRCSICGKKSKNINDLFSCIKGHDFVGTIQENVAVYLNEEGRNFVNAILKEINFKKVGFNFFLSSNELIKIADRMIYLLQCDSKFEYIFSEIPEFDQFPEYRDIDHETREYLKIFIDNLKEKCPDTGTDTCRDICPDDQRGLCIQRMMAEFIKGELGPHYGLEYGDFSFSTRIDNISQSVICLVKSYRGKGHGHPFTPSDDGRLISQVLWAANTGPVDFIAIVSGERLDPRLKGYIGQIIRSRKKRYVFLERTELIQIAKAYIDKKRGKNYRLEIKFDEIPVFQQCPSLKRIDPNIIDDLRAFVTDLGEKCSKQGHEQCSTCLKERKGLCIQRVIAEFAGGDLALYPGLKCGYLSFGIKMDRKSYTVACLTKSYRSKGPKTRFTTANNGGLLSHIQWAASREPVDIIAIASGKLLDSQLKDHIRQFIEYGNKRLVFLEEDELLRIAAHVKSLT